MNYATIKNCDIANGPGVRVSLFVSGCTHRCPGCFNEVAWDFDYGEPFTGATVESILNMLRPSYIKGLTLLGGEPFEPQNQGPIVALLRRIKEEPAGEVRLGLLRVPVRPGHSVWPPGGLQRIPVVSGRAGGRPVCGGEEKSVPPVPGL